jgi:hypothetical protein
MAPKETKKDRERRLKKAEELTTDAPTDDPTDDDEPDDELAYDAEGGLVKPGTSAAAAAAAASVATNAVASTIILSDSSNAEGFATQGEKGSARARTGTGTPQRQSRQHDAVDQVQAQEVKEIEEGEA